MTDLEISSSCSKPLFCLSLLSGGMKSCFQAVILSEIEKRTKSQVHELFDYVVGVSAGSLCAAFLTAPKSENRAQDLVQFFKTRLAKVFATSRWHKIKTLNGLIGSKFENQLQEAAYQQFENLSISECTTNVMILSYSLTKDRAKYFKSWDTKEGGRLSDICLASSAIPGFFSPVQIDTETYFDGALVSSNGSTALLGEILKKTPGLNPKNIKMLTIGVGNYKEVLQPNASLLKWVWSDNHSPLLATLLKDEVANDTAKLLIGDTNYFYFNPRIDVTEYNATTDTTQLDQLIELANKWISEHDYEISSLCQALMEHKKLRSANIKLS